jgi:hypothetical protein
MDITELPDRDPRSLQTYVAGWKIETSTSSVKRFVERALAVK